MNYPSNSSLQIVVLRSMINQNKLDDAIDNLLLILPRYSRYYPQVELCKEKMTQIRRNYSLGLSNVALDSHNLKIEIWQIVDDLEFQYQEQKRLERERLEDIERQRLENLRIERNKQWRFAGLFIVVIVTGILGVNYYLDHQPHPTPSQTFVDVSKDEELTPKGLPVIEGKYALCLSSVPNIARARRSRMKHGGNILKCLEQNTFRIVMAGYPNRKSVDKALSNWSNEIDKPFIISYSVVEYKVFEEYYSCYCNP